MLNGVDKYQLINVLQTLLFSYHHPSLKVSEDTSMPKAKLIDFHAKKTFKPHSPPSDVPPLMTASDNDEDELGMLLRYYMLDDLLLHRIGLLSDVTAQSGREASVESRSSDFAVPEDLTDIIANYTEDANDKNIAETIVDCDDDG